MKQIVSPVILQKVQLTASSQKWIYFSKYTKNRLIVASHTILLNHFIYIPILKNLFFLEPYTLQKAELAKKDSDLNGKIRI